MTSVANRIGKSILLGCALLLVRPALSANGADDVVILRGKTMGTTFHVTIPSNQVGTDLNVFLAPIDARLKQINQRMSTYEHDSEVSRFNRAPANEWFEVSDETASVVARAKEIAEDTDGAFDITVGPVVRLWNFGPKSSDAFSVPSDQAIEAALEVIGTDKLEFCRAPPALRKLIDGLEIDLSAIAKGYAVDQVSELLVSQYAISDSMVEIGGEIRVRGKKPDGTPWRVGIESPVQNRRETYGVITPVETSIASSGNYRNYHEVSGKSYSHTIDPRTGYPVQHESAAVTVLAEDCATADALATRADGDGARHRHPMGRSKRRPSGIHCAQRQGLL